ncbi:transglutaminase domain-containing protein [Paraflavitalea sp. CAU 1676]|uniref:transglutaminase-like domain-containing protein n=1 Tax=Paraflavitalea sp. CAU 1676 TaxID=3032598 RepID=UPI0023D9F2BC|nr:transglutaminase domain-containing protein [Paraflavitalea sp. CAU 1676]MDF2190151.1 transglutaminase domain-containing protein [Paraflavitalea sp. CAU 1676]
MKQTLPMAGSSDRTPAHFARTWRAIGYSVLTFISVCCYEVAAAQAVHPEDLNEAESLARVHKDEQAFCRSSYHFFTFGKGTNALNDKVVVVQEEAEMEFLGLKKYGGLTYAEFYNKFIRLKQFKKSVKVGSKWVLSDRSGIDRSVTDENIFFDDSRVQYFPIRFNNQGNVARVTVKKEYTDAKYLTRIFFHSFYPIKEQVIEFKVPEWLSIDFKTFNFEGAKIEKKQTQKGGYTNYVFIMKDLPARTSEFKQIGKAYTDPHIVIQVKSFEAKGEVLQGFDKVNDVYNWNNRLYKMANNDPEKLKATLTKITAGATNDQDKIKAIYYYVQDKVRYIAYEDGYSGYIPTSAQEVLANKYGDCKGMANLLTEFLKLAGYDAHFTWIGTRQLPYPQSTPALCVNNHAITTLYFKGKEYFLDATEKYVPFGENAYRIQGKEAMIANGDKFDIKKVPLTTGDEHKVFTKASFNLNNEQLKGNIQVTLTGNERKDFHQEYQELPNTSREKFLNGFLEFNNDNVEASDVKTSDLNNRDIPITISGNIDLSNYVQSIAGNKYINLDFFPKTLERYMPDEKRKSGYDFDYVLSYEDEFSLTIPAGNKFADVPEKLELKQEGYEFRGEYTITGNKITLKKYLVIKNSMIDKKDFTNWKNFLESIKSFSSYFFSITTK